MEVITDTIKVDLDEFVVRPDPMDLCRLCANTDNQLIPIFKGEGIEHNIPNKIEKHLPVIKVTEQDKLPLQICYQCASTLIAWNNLYEGSKVADKRLRELLCVQEGKEDVGVEDTFDDYTDYQHDFDDAAQTEELIDSIASPKPSTSKEVDTPILGLQPNKPASLVNEEVITDDVQAEANDERYNDWERVNIPGTRGAFTSSGQQPSLCPCIWRIADGCEKCRKSNASCPVCKKQWLRDCSACNRHIRQTHGEAVLRAAMTDLTGLDCDKVLLDDNVEPVYCRQEYQCVTCDDIYFDKPSLLSHLNEHKKSTMKQYRCVHCGKVWFSRRAFVVHLRAHETTKARGKAGSNALVARSYRSSKGYYSCTQCDQIFLKRHSFTRHVNTHLVRQRYACDMCNRRFATAKARDSHYTKHELPPNVFVLDGQKYLRCEQCPFTCRFERNKLEEHIRVHTGEKPFTCELCGKQFRTIAFLRVHRRYVHDGVKEHRCEICGRGFSNKRYMVEHRRIHTGEKPLVCDLCGRLFRQTSSLTKHIENHLGVKRHVCHLCDKRFSNRHHLNIHVKRHLGEANFVCKQCGKGFVDQYQLKNHQVVHSEERPYVCALCGMRFKLLKHLKQHGKTHK